MIKKRILYLLAPLVTFALGIGVDRLISQRPVTSVIEPPQIERVAAIQEPPTAVLPTIAPVEQSAPPPVPQPILLLDYPKGKFGIEAAGFYIMGAKPKELTDFVIEMSLSRDREVNLSSIGVSERDADVWKYYAASFALVTEQRVFFATSNSNESGVEYRFDGEFVRTDFDSVVYKNKAVLRGTLTKTKDGRTIAERVVSLRMEYHGC